MLDRHNDGEPPLLQSRPDELMRTTPTNAAQAPGRTPYLPDDRSRCPRSTRLASSRCTKNNHPSAFRVAPDGTNPSIERGNNVMSLSPNDAIEASNMMEGAHDRVVGLG
jgi:hypothetical protein